MTSMKTVWIGLLTACFLSVPATALAQGPGDMDPAGVDETDELDDDDDEDRPWRLGGGIRMMVGQGTFVSPANDTEFADEVHDGSGAYNRVSMLFAVNSSYQWNNFEFSGEIGFSQNLTAAGGSTRPYEGRLQDFELGASYGGEEGYEIGDTGISVSPSIGMDLPTSTASRTRTMLASLSAGASISRTFFDRLSLSYSLGGSRTFHQHPNPVLDEEEIRGEDDFGSPLYRADGTEAVGPGRFAIGQVNTEWGMSHGIGAQVMFSERVMAGANYALQTGWSYPVAGDDEFAHERQCSGRCPGQLSMGGVMVNYLFNENIMINAGLNTRQRPKTADNKSFNFPFWNFNGAARNASMINVGVMGS